MADTHALYGEELQPGALVGGYVVERTWHRGPGATLYRARQQGGGALAALKVLRPQLALHRAALARFAQEVAILRRLRHPHIVELLGSGELGDGRPWLLMEWLEGRDLGAELAARGRLALAEALALAEQVGAALQAAHRAGVVHRDLKAQNVMLLAGSGAPTLKLVDFGVARLLGPGEQRSGVTSTGALVGTPLSMAPEQIRGEALDERADIYALGVLLYQLLTGQPPFAGATPLELMEQHLHVPAPRLGERVPVPPAVEAVVQRCLAKRREERYAEVGPLLAELRRAAHGAEPPQPARAVGLYVEARPVGPQEDEALEALDSVLEAAGPVLQAAGLAVVLEGGNFLLAVAALPEEPQAEQAVRERALEAARALEQQVQALGAGEQVALAMALRVDTATLHPEPSGPVRLTGGGLLRLAEWTAALPGRGLVTVA